MMPKRYIEALVRIQAFGIPIVMTSLMLFSMLVSSDTRVLTSLSFACLFLMSLYSPRFGLFTTILLIPLLELPTLLLGYPNFFLIDFTMTAFCLACSIRFFSLDKFSLASLLSNPLLMGGLFLIPLVAISLVAEMAQMRAWAPGAYNYSKLINLLGHNLFIWDQRSNPFHGLSIALGIAVVITFAFWLNYFLEQKIVIRSEAMGALVLGGVIACLCSFPRFFGWIQVGDDYVWEGSFQNPNHLSFFCGIILCLVSFASRHYPQMKQKIIFGSVAMFFLLFFYLGYSRTSFIALVAASLACLLCYRRLLAANKNQLKTFNFRIMFACLTVVTLILIDRLDWFSTHFTDSIMALAERSWIAGGREHLYYALELAQNQWWHGIGLGNFFLRSHQAYEIHNSYLAWLTELGILSIPAMIIASILYLGGLRRFSYSLATQMLSLWLIIFVGIVIFMDPLLSYRSLFASVVVAMSLASHWAPHQISPDLMNKIDRKSSPWVYGLILLGCLQGCPVVLAPGSRAPIMQNQGNFSSASPYAKTLYAGAYSESLSCLTTSVLPSWQRGTRLAIGLSCHGAPTNVNTVADLLQWETQLTTIKHVAVAGRQERICICLETTCPQSNQDDLDYIYLRSHWAQIPRLADDPLHWQDFQLWLSFEFGSGDTDLRPNQLQSKSPCDQAITL